MSRLILSLDNQVLAEYNMTKERYTIGRLPDNDVRIDNPAVSGHHSLIINILNDSFLEDLNSTNGTYVNGKLIKKHALQHGDVITIGHHQLRFSEQQVNDAEQDEFEKTMVIPASQQSADQLAAAEKAAEAAAAAHDDPSQPPPANTMAHDDPSQPPPANAMAHDDPSQPPPSAAAAHDDPSQPPPSAAAAHDDPSQPPPAAAPDPGVKLNDDEAGPLAPESEPEPAPEPAPAPDTRSHTETQTGVDPSSAPKALPLAKMQVLSGAFAGRELELTKALTTLGRPGVQVAAITRRAEGYFIVHVESGKENDYPLVNGEPIGAQARKLNDNDVVELAGVKMGFFLN